VAIIPVILCASALYAQTSGDPEPCPAYAALVDDSPSPKQETNQSQPAQPKSVAIDAVDFDGPTALPNADLAQFVFSLEEHQFVSTSNWLDEVVSRWVRGAWQDDGYFKVSASATYTTIWDDSANQHVALHIHVDPGLQYFMGDLRFSQGDPRCPLVFAADELRGLVTIQKGDLFRASKINESDRAVYKFYNSHGYVNFDLDLVFAVDDASQRINLNMRLTPRRQYRIGTLEVQGLAPVMADMWKSLFTPGDILDEGSIDRLFEEYKPALPPNTSLREVDFHPRYYDDSGIVDLGFDFEKAPQQNEGR
jgi:hypothetical protein